MFSKLKVCENISTQRVTAGCNLFNDNASSSDCIVSNDRMNNDLERMWKESVMTLRCYTGICLEELSKTREILSQDSRSPSRGQNLGPPEYESGVLITQPRCLVSRMEKIK
jgi:hypothetical protein